MCISLSGFTFPVENVGGDGVGEDVRLGMSWGFMAEPLVFPPSLLQH